MKTSVSRVITTSMPGWFSSSFFKPERHVEHELGLVHAVAVHAGIVPAVAGIEHDAGNAEPELPGQRELTVGVREREGRRRQARRHRA